MAGCRGRVRQKARRGCFTVLVTDERLISDVREWLENGGYILEMLVARSLQARNALVEQGYRYRDPVTGQEREGDISGFSVFPDFPSVDDVPHGYSLMVECKNTTAPWVLFSGSKFGSGSWTPSYNFDENCHLCSGMDWRYLKLRSQMPRAYAITQKGARSDGKDSAYEAVQQVTSAVLGRYAHDQRAGHHDASTAADMAIPVVVTQSPLVVCSLDHDGQVALSVQERVLLHVPRIDVPSPEAGGLDVMVLNFAGLEEFLNDVDDVKAAAFARAMQIVEGDQRPPGPR